MRIAFMMIPAYAFWGTIIIIFFTRLIYNARKDREKNPKPVRYVLSAIGVMLLGWVLLFTWLDNGLKREREIIKNQIKKEITLTSDQEYSAEDFNNTTTGRYMTVRDIEWVNGSGTYEISEDRTAFTISGDGEVNITFYGYFAEINELTGHYFVIEDDAIEIDSAES